MKTQYRKPTKTIRRALGKEGACQSYSGNGASARHLYNWQCERPDGHKGDHMAWEDYETGRLYEGGRWK